MTGRHTVGEPAVPSLRPGPRPVGRRQQMAYLLVWAALHRASLLAADNNPRDRVGDAENEAAQARQLVTSPAPREHAAALGHTVARHAIVQREYVNALTAIGRHHVDLGSVVDGVGAAELAAARSRQHDFERTRAAVATFVEHYRSEYGLLIDVDSAVIGIDPSFDAEADQHRREGATQWNRERAAIAAACSILDRIELTDTDKALARAQLVIPRSRTERDQIWADLADLGIAEHHCTTVLFVMDYLCGRTADVDLIGETPVLLDPGEEIKGAIRDTLHTGADPRYWDIGVAPEDALSGIAFEDTLSLLVAPDQHRVRAGRDAILSGAGDSVPLWPEYVNRDALDQQLRIYSAWVEIAHGYAKRVLDRPDELAEDARAVQGLHDLLDGLGAQRATLRAHLQDGFGLLPIEAQHIEHTLDELDLGDTVLPEMLLVGELHKRDRDLHRYAHLPIELASTARGQMIAVLEDAGVPIFAHDADHEPPPWDDSVPVHTISSHIEQLARGASNGGHHSEQEFEYALGKLVSTLETAGGDTTVCAALGAMVRGYVRSAQFHGAEMQERRVDWHSHITEIVRTRDLGTLAGSDADPNHARDISAADTVGADRGGDFIAAALPESIDRSPMTESSLRPYSHLPALGAGSEAGPG
ncbi:hypothetical protein [Nocardia sp. CA-119907]|uniref:hypothetical protein n=1 Tax=Nocardia sp. CA-119907 TaxID=3239973 RepID=UPI003D9775BA